MDYGDRSNPHVRVMGILSLIFCLIFLFLKLESVSALDYLTYENVNMRIQLKYPQTWERIDGESSVSFVSPINSDSNNFNEGLGIIKASNTSAKAILSTYSKVATGFSSNKIGNTTLSNGLVVFSSSYGAFNQDGSVINGKDLIITVDNSTYILSYKAKPATYHLYLPIVNSMINSFRVISSNHSAIDFVELNNIENKIQPNRNTNFTLLDTKFFANEEPLSVVFNPTNNQVYVASKIKSNNSVIFESSDIIHVFNSTSMEFMSTLHLEKGQHIIDMVVDPASGDLFAVGVENYLNGSKKYANDTVYLFDQKENRTGLQLIKKITLSSGPYYNKEGGLFTVTVDPLTNIVYAGMKYYMGGYNGIFVIKDGESNITNYDLENGPLELKSDPTSKFLYAADPTENEISILDSRNGSIVDIIIIEDPRAMSIDASLRKLFVASQKNNWFNVIDLNTNKVVAGITGLKNPKSSFVNTDAHTAYVLETNEDKGYFGGENSYIYEISGDTNSLTRDHIVLDAILEDADVNTNTGMIYTVGSNSKDIHSQNSEGRLYIIKISR